jgi:hypothetical protein
LGDAADGFIMDLTVPMFSKLDITSRNQLDRVRPGHADSSRIA